MKFSNDRDIRSASSYRNYWIVESWKDGKAPKKTKEKKMQIGYQSKESSIFILCDMFFTFLIVKWVEMQNARVQDVYVSCKVTG